MGRIGAESAKQAEIGVADLWQILSIAVTERGAEVGFASQRAFIVDSRLGGPAALISGKNG
jgi:hypothetical protein